MQSKRRRSAARWMPGVPLPPSQHGQPPPSHCPGCCPHPSLEAAFALSSKHLQHSHLPPLPPLVPLVINCPFFLFFFFNFWGGREFSPEGTGFISSWQRRREAAQQPAIALSACRAFTTSQPCTPRTAGPQPAAVLSPPGTATQPGAVPRTRPGWEHGRVSRTAPVLQRPWQGWHSTVEHPHSHMAQANSSPSPLLLPFPPLPLILILVHTNNMNSNTNILREWLLYDKCYIHSCIL